MRRQQELNFEQQKQKNQDREKFHAQLADLRGADPRDLDARKRAIAVERLRKRALRASLKA
jgi:hypothetical protein